MFIVEILFLIMIVAGGVSIVLGF